MPPTRLAILLALGILPGVARGQGVAARAGHFFDTAGMTSYQISWSTPVLGVLAADLGGVMWQGPTASERRLGLTADAALFRGGRPGPYAVGGVGGGFASGGAESRWRTWSAGLGFELIPASFMSLGLEGRWREFQPSGRSGMEFSLRLGTSFGRPVGVMPPRTVATGAPIAVPVILATSEPGHTVDRADAGSVLADVIQIAQEQMGTPYRYGGTGRGDDGFDCSGLIQYAYRQAGISIPRQSRDQARTGRAVERSSDALQPGDILTFAQHGRRITHVGLYLGDGRFIHSASKGVQISTLGTDDPNGRWWYQRWIGVRRVVTPAP